MHRFDPLAYTLSASYLQERADSACRMALARYALQRATAPAAEALRKLGIEVPHA